MRKIHLGDAIDLAQFPDPLTQLDHQMTGVRQDIAQLVDAKDVAENP